MPDTMPEPLLQPLNAAVIPRFAEARLSCARRA
jgi:hypothetical protein